VDQKSIFIAPRRYGLIFHGVALSLFATVSGLGIWQVFRVDIGPEFLIYVLLSITAAGLLPVLAYRAYALRGAYYILERDGIRLHWGLRTEDIPMSAVLWARPASDRQYLPEQSLPLPWPRWPGAILGTRRLSNGVPVEYMAADLTHMALIATAERVFAISPANLDEFMFVYQRLTELGSLTSIQGQSLYPTFLVSEIWRNRFARILLVSGIALNIILLGWVSLIIPSRDQITLSLIEEFAVPSTRLFMLPLINTSFFLVDAILGLFLYRRSETLPPPPTGRGESAIANIDRPLTQSARILAYTLWSASIVTTIFFLIAVYFIAVFG